MLHVACRCWSLSRTAHSGSAAIACSRVSNRNRASGASGATPASAAMRARCFFSASAVPGLAAAASAADDPEMSSPSSSPCAMPSVGSRPRAIFESTQTAPEQSVDAATLASGCTPLLAVGSSVVSTATAACSSGCMRWRRMATCVGTGAARRRDRGSAMAAREPKPKLKAKAKPKPPRPRPSVSPSPRPRPRPSARLRPRRSPSPGPRPRLSPRLGPRPRSSPSRTPKPDARDPNPNPNPKP
mmetsp:Transcript_28979/g.92664  ORF Transcript_28979/g.92664 Transcript_28979/m.92664 type:complete len:243 (-) Transcript_28979:33-761(-)